MVTLLDTPQQRGGKAGGIRLKHFYGGQGYSGAFHYAAPLMDWARMRWNKKNRCVFCPHYDWFLDGCSYGYMLDNGPQAKV